MQGARCKVHCSEPHLRVYSVGRGTCPRREFRFLRNSHRPQDDPVRECLPNGKWIFPPVAKKSGRGQVPRPTL